MEQAARRLCTVGLQQGRTRGEANKGGPSPPSFSTDLAHGALPLQCPGSSWRITAVERCRWSGSLPGVVCLFPQPARTADGGDTCTCVTRLSCRAALRCSCGLYSQGPRGAASRCLSPERRLQPGFRTSPALGRFLRSLSFAIGRCVCSRKGGEVGSVITEMGAGPTLQGRRSHKNCLTVLASHGCCRAETHLERSSLWELKPKPGKWHISTPGGTFMCSLLHPITAAVTRGPRGRRCAFPTSL